MYPVSEAFLQAVQGNTRKYYWTGKITTVAGVEYSFTQEDIVKGSGYITAQCCGNSEIELGAVYAAEMGISLFLDIDRYTLEDAKVELSYHLRLADGSYEAVPMGIFEVSEANRTAHVLELKAYDYMLRFDRDFNGFETIGTAYGMMALCGTACGVELAQSQAEIEALPNGSELLSIYPENDIETYRDVLTFSGGQADSQQITCVTSFTVKIGGRQSLKCVGKNPRLSQAKSKNDKNISGLLNQIEAGKIGIHTFTNASAYTLGETNVRIISIEFASKEENHAQFFGQVVVDVVADTVERTANANGTIVVPFPATAADSGTDTNADSTEGGAAEDSTEVSVDVSLPVTWTEDGKVICYVTFELNDAEILLHRPVETWHSGKHILSLYYPIENVVPNITNTFNVYLRMENGSGTVGIGDCIASISGQAMAAAAAWDGKITIEESAGLFAIGGGLQVKNYADVMAMETMELVQRIYSDTITGRTSIGAFCRPVTLA